MVRELIFLPLRITTAVVGGLAGVVRSRLEGDQTEPDYVSGVAEEARTWDAGRQPASAEPSTSAGTSTPEREAVRGRNPDASDWDEDAPVPPGGSDPDDLIITDRVKTELFGAVDAPTGQINLNVEDGVVYLRGHLEDPAQIEELVELAGAIEGVVRVEDLIAR